MQRCQQVQALDPAPGSPPALYSAWRWGRVSPPFCSPQSCNNKARGAESPTSSPASGCPPERRHVADGVVAKHSYRFGACSRWVPLEQTDRQCKHLQEGTLPTACSGNVFPRCCQRPALRDRQVVNSRQAKPTPLAAHGVTIHTATRLL